MIAIIRPSCLSFLLLAGAAAQAQEMPKSLLFSPAESESIARALTDFERMNVTGQSVEEAAPLTVPNIYVSAIVDFGDGQWTVWANGYRISPNHQTPQFTVTSVQNDSAEIQISGEKPEKILLRPYQTWMARSHSIVEGIVP